ncbi:unnamed protein product [Trifolium pratense]|uniref:Uncharacterized protein n=1 Tax=Trifolium pratense TaxID=57577 RepID=A0ACB0LVJ6_TRIPR|nr:unnamed protein product [Trifolium pratense]
MAESLLFSVAETFIGKLTSRVLDEASLALGVYDDLRRIKDTSSLIKAVLLDAEQKQWQNNELREWLRQIKHVFSDAEDVIDDFECEALRMQVVNTSGSIRRKVRRFFSSSNPFVYRVKMAHQIIDINARLAKVAADRHNFDCLPLAIRTLGSSLFLKFDIEEWNFVKDSELWNLPQQDDGILPAIKLSYDQLPSYLKQCFACFSLFEKSIYYYDPEVTGIWDALDFLPTPENGENSGDIGKQLLLELWSRSFLQNFVYVGGSFCFELHDLVHDLALYVARDDFQLLNFQYENIRENVRHLSVLQNDLLSQISIPTGLRTILFPDGANSKPFLNNCLSRCKYLRLLEINNSRYKNLPRSIGKLKHLRCFRLVNNQELERLPDSVCKLQNLQTLELTNCQKLQKLPNGIGNLIKLQELYITTRQSNFPKELAKLSSLKILEFSYCDNLMFSFEGIQFPKLKLLAFASCGNLKSLPFHIIPNIETLIIVDCNMVILSMGDNNNQIPNIKLKFLSLDSLPQIVTFPQWVILSMGDNNNQTPYIP